MKSINAFINEAIITSDITEKDIAQTISEKDILQLRTEPYYIYKQVGNNKVKLYTDSDWVQNHNAVMKFVNQFFQFCKTANEICIKYYGNDFVIFRFPFGNDITSILFDIYSEGSYNIKLFYDKRLNKSPEKIEFDRQATETLLSTGKYVI